jgi:hypothetical protein
MFPRDALPSVLVFEFLGWAVVGKTAGVLCDYVTEQLVYYVVAI